MYVAKQEQGTARGSTLWHTYLDSFWLCEKPLEKLTFSDATTKELFEFSEPLSAPSRRRRMGPDAGAPSRGRARARTPLSFPPLYALSEARWFALGDSWMGIGMPTDSSDASSAAPCFCCNLMIFCFDLRFCAAFCHTYIAPLLVPPHTHTLHKPPRYAWCSHAPRQTACTVCRSCRAPNRDLEGLVRGVWCGEWVGNQGTNHLAEIITLLQLEQAVALRFGHKRLHDSTDFSLVEIHRRVVCPKRCIQP